MEKKQTNESLKIALVIFLSTLFILLTQGVKLVKDPTSLPITLETLQGLAVLLGFSLVGVLTASLAKKWQIKILKDLPILAWVSIVSLIFCLLSDYFVKVIGAVDFLSITTPILAFAGISVADNLVDLRKISWKIAIVAVFVFIGTYLGSALLAQLGLMLSGK